MSESPRHSVHSLDWAPPWAGRVPAGASLDEDAIADVVVIGAGIVGCTTAYVLAAAGRDVRLLDHRWPGAGATGATTAKISALHTLVYDELRRDHGVETAAAYAKANLDGLDWIAERVGSFDDDCAFSRRPALTYVTDPDEVDAMAREVTAATDAGLPVGLTVDTDLPFPVAAAARLGDQAQFDPMRYLACLTRAFRDLGGTLHVGARATGVHARSDRLEVQTDGSTITADHVVVATGLPFLDRSLHFARVEPRRSYAIAVAVDEEAVRDLPSSMSISADSPTRSLRTIPQAPGEATWLLVGGEGHKVGQEPDTWGPYERLEEWARRYFPVTSVERRWSTQDYVSPDGLPFIGGAGTLPTNVLVATGFSKWGMAMGTTAGLLLAREVQDGAAEHPFGAGRLGLRGGVGDVVRHNADVAAHLVTDRVKGLICSSDTAGPTCPHLGGTLHWNPAEQSWDCPLHGSRFDADGVLLHGPAVRDLDPDAVARSAPPGAREENPS